MGAHLLPAVWGTLVDIYTLDDAFIRDKPVEGFKSAIWTERYSEAGDFQIVVPARPSVMDLLQEGTFLECSESDDIMLIDTQSIQNGLLTVSGPSLVKFLNNRVYRFSTKQWTPFEEWDGLRPSETIGYIVYRMCVYNAIWRDYLISYGLDPDHEYLSNFSVQNVHDFSPPAHTLSIGRPIGIGGDLVLSGDSVPFTPAIDPSDAATNMQVSSGHLYDVIERIASFYSVGIKILLDYADPDGYHLTFKTYKGRILTSEQTQYPVVRFSPNLGTLTNISELRSNAAYKNVAYCYIPNLPETIGIGDPAVDTELNVGPGIAYLDEASRLAIDFNRRVLLVLDSQLNMDAIPKTDMPTAVAAIKNVLDMSARDALANNTFTRVVDGEVVPQGEYKYGTHYQLGDVIELQSYSGNLQKARVTEYIRSQDATGERAYPTVSVIDSLVTPGGASF